jgi:hypothetical protein
MRLPALIAAACALLLAAPAAAAPPKPAPKPAPGLTLIDLTPQFAQAYEATKSLPDDQKVAVFDAAFAKLLPGFYDAARPGAGGARYPTRVLRALNAFPEQRAGIEAISSRFAAMLAPAQASFEARFGPMVGYPPIYLVDSLNEFDGGTRELPDGVRLIFGADVIARIHARHAIQPFFHHELFHILHQRTFKGCEQVWCTLWQEGLAVHVATELNPGATDDELLLTQPAPIRAAVDANRAEAVCAVTARLDSTDEKAMNALFSFDRLAPNLPPRFGYYVGSLVAKDLGRSRSLAELARLDNAHARPLIVAALHRLATCPPA